MKVGSGLDTPVQFLKGIGPKRAAQLGKLGIETVGQLLLHVPHRYVDRSRTLPIRDLREGEDVSVFGKVAAIGSRRTRNHRQLVTCVIQDDSGAIEAAWFNRPGLQERFKVGMEVLLSGRVSFYRGRRLVNPDFEVLEDGGEASGDRMVVPVYPSTEGLSGWTVRRAIGTALERFRDELVETLPGAVREHYRFPGVRDALGSIHFPTSVAAAEEARRRFVYEELFYLELVLALRRQRLSEEKKGNRLRESGRITGPFRRKLGFSLTGAQERVIGELTEDMARDRCMNRLLQGDVGAGKTVVALYAMLVACENEAQAVMMAPTEILAFQHHAGWGGVLEECGVSVRLLTGSTPRAERREILAGLRSGEVDVLFGTHALIEQEVVFSRLGLAVVDEQHRFGVLQRAALLAKGLNPDFLVMTATPIPRTLTLTVYGDLDVSVLDEKPPGREPVVTRVVPETRRDRVYGFVEERLAAGEQAFVICPLVEESEKLELKSATDMAEQVRRAFPGRQVALAHGRMPGRERRDCMDSFRRGESDILVATTVIEVGVDIPNATVMLIEHPERFGLAQLHQLRGRIGRGSAKSYCVLMLPNRGAGLAGERLAFFARTTDGFALAEKDLELRGPGEILGTRQHGLPDLRIADIVRDQSVLADARRDAFRLVELDPTLQRTENGLVRRTLLERYGGREDLLRVG